MKSMKKVLSILLMLCMLSSMLPVSALAAGEHIITNGNAAPPVQPEAACEHGHVHTADCGGDVYADNCTYLCQGCADTLQIMVDALPAMAEVTGNKETVAQQMTAIDAAKAGTSDTTRNAVNWKKYEDAAFVLATPPNFFGFSITKRYEAGAAKTPAASFAFINAAGERVDLWTLSSGIHAFVGEETVAISNGSCAYYYLPADTYTLSEIVEGKWDMTLAVNGMEKTNAAFTGTAGEFYAVQATNYSIDPELELTPGENGWYTAAHLIAAEGFLISMTEAGPYKDSTAVPDGIYDPNDDSSPLIYYYQDESEYCFDNKLSIPHEIIDDGILKVDGTAPVIASPDIGSSNRIFADADGNVTMVVEDKHSGLDLSRTEVLNNSNDDIHISSLPNHDETKVTYTITGVEADTHYELSLNLYDKAGNLYNGTVYLYGPCTTHTDTDSDNICDRCEATFYDVWVNGIRVTETNAADILGNGNGELSYDPNTKTLTVNQNVTLNKSYADSMGQSVLCSMDDLTITGSGKLTLAADIFAVSVYGNLTITDLALEITKAQHAILATKDISIRQSNINAVSTIDTIQCEDIVIEDTVLTIDSNAGKGISGACVIKDGTYVHIRTDYRGILGSVQFDGTDHHLVIEASDIFSETITATGYWRDSADGAFAYGSVPGDANGYLEFIGSGHLSYDAMTNALTCAHDISIPVVASVTMNGNMTYYPDFVSALAAANEGTATKPATLKLLADVTGLSSSSPMYLGEEDSSFTLDLNGHTISGQNTNNALFKMENNANVTITDSGTGGTIEATSGWAVQADAGKLTVAGGAVKGVSIGMLITDNASLTVKDGKIEGGNNANSNAIQSSGILKITGGEIVSGNIGVWFAGGSFELDKSPVISGNRGSLYIANGACLSVGSALSGTYTMYCPAAPTAESAEPVVFAGIVDGGSAAELAKRFVPTNNPNGYLVAVPHNSGNSSADDQLALQYCKHSTVTDGKCSGCGTEFEVRISDSTYSYERCYSTLAEAMTDPLWTNDSVTGMIRLHLLTNVSGNIESDREFGLYGNGLFFTGTLTVDAVTLDNVTIVAANKTAVTVGNCANIGTGVWINSTAADFHLLTNGMLEYSPSSTPNSFSPYTVSVANAPEMGGSRVIDANCNLSGVYSSAKTPYLVTSTAGGLALTHLVKSVTITMNGTTVSNGTARYNSYPAVVVVRDYNNARVNGNLISVVWYDSEGNSLNGLSPVNAGSYRYKVTGMTGTAYEGFSNEGTLTIEKASLTNISWNGYDGNKTYDGVPADMPYVVFTYPGSGSNNWSTGTYSWKLEGNTDWVPVETAEDMPIDAGEYILRADFAGNDNVVNGHTEETLTIAPMGLGDVSAASATYTGEALTPAVTVQSAAGRTLNENADYTVSYSDNVNAGTGTVTVTGKGNYTGTKEAVFTILPKTISSVTVTVAEGDYTYTGKAIEPAVTVKDGETVIPAGEYSVSYSQNVNVGTATITVTDKDGGNYTVPETDADFIITPAKLTITAEDKSAPVGGKAPALTYTVTGLLGNDKLVKAPTLAYATTPNMNRAGTTEIVASGADAGSNYTIEYVKGKLTVYVPTTQVRVDMSGIVLGDKVYDGKALGYTGAAKGNYNVQFVYVWLDAYGNRVDAPVNAGTYRLRATVNTYGYTGYAEKTVHIEKAQITVTAADLTAELGAELPELTYTLKGLAPGDKLKTQPSLTCAADMDTAGEYAITASGAAVPNTKNYEAAVKYVDGTLTVAEAAPAATSEPTEATEEDTVVTPGSNALLIAPAPDAGDNSSEDSTASTGVISGADIEDAQAGSGPSFPWWILLVIAAAIGGYLWYRKKKA